MGATAGLSSSASAQADKPPLPPSGSRLTEH